MDQFSNDLGTSVARPICHEFTTDSKFAYVTMAGGGLLVVEVGNSGRALDEAFPELPLTWVELERGGHGVFVISKDDLPAL